MKTISLRGVNPETLATLKALAASNGSSVNTLLLRIIEQGVGRGTEKIARKRFSDLDSLAGLWTASEANSFAAAVDGFSQIDSALWK